MSIDYQSLVPPDKRAPEEDLQNVNAMKVIRRAAEAMGILLNDPKPNCKKCHGRGYLGRHVDSGEPVPCPCLFPKPDREVGDVQLRPRNRAERRAKKH